MASSGKFSQTNSDNGLEIDYSQNSLLTIGYLSSYYPKDKPHSYAASAYYSTLNVSDSNLDQKVNVPAEIGLNAYYQYHKPEINYYGGLDFEKFAAFNSNTLVSQSELDVIETKVLYATVGISKVFTVKTYDIFSKFSFSKTLRTSTEFSGYDSAPDEYDGYKAMSYFQYKFKEKWFSHVLVKYISMIGPDDLSTFRYGVGIGYTIN
jgi:hypothetical protein